MPTPLAKQRSGPGPPAAADLAAIDAYAASNEFRVAAVTEGENHWYYWLRGKIFLSNIARIFVVTAEDLKGTQRQIHIAITGGALGQSRKLKVLLEEDVA